MRFVEKRLNKDPALSGAALAELIQRQFNLLVQMIMLLTNMVLAHTPWGTEATT